MRVLMHVTVLDSTRLDMHSTLTKNGHTNKRKKEGMHSSSMTQTRNHGLKDVTRALGFVVRLLLRLAPFNWWEISYIMTALLDRELRYNLRTVRTGMRQVLTQIPISHHVTE